MRTKLAFIGLALVSGLLVLSFVVKQRQFTLPADSSLTTQLPCKFPCWHGLTPGASTADDVRRLTATDSFVPTNQYQKDFDPARWTNTLYWWFGSPQNANRLVIEDGILYHIQISPNIDFSIQDILNIYGRPAGVLTTFENRISEGKIYIQLSLYYPVRGLIVDFSFLGGYPADTKYDLPLNTLGSGFRVYRPSDSLRDFVSQTTGFQTADLDKVMNNLMTSNWPGSTSVIIPPKHINEPILILTATPFSSTTSPR